MVKWMKPKLRDGRVSGRVNVRDLLAMGPVQTLTVDRVQADTKLAACAVDPYTLIIQHCPSLSFLPLTNDTLRVPEIIVRDCGGIELPAIVECSVITIEDSCLLIKEQVNSVRINGTLTLTNSTLIGDGKLIVNGDLFVDSETYGNISDFNITYRKIHDIGEVERRATG